MIHGVILTGIQMYMSGCYLARIKIRYSLKNPIRISRLDIWYADYNRYSRTSYHFAILQYTSSGKVGKIGGYVDLDIQVIEK